MLKVDKDTVKGWIQKAVAKYLPVFVANVAEEVFAKIEEVKAAGML